MTTDAFSPGFSFADDDKKPTSPPPDAPNSPPASDSVASDAKDSLDPFAGFSFGFEAAPSDDSGLPDLAALPAETSEFAPEIEAPEIEAPTLEIQPLETKTFEIEKEASENPETENSEISPALSFDLGEIPVVEPALSASAPEVVAPDAIDLSETAPSEPEISSQVPPAQIEDEDEVAPIEIVVPASAVVAASAAAVDENDPFAPFIKAPAHHATVAILGASGIGKNHARWFTKHGCQVVAFLGTSDESNEATQRELARDFGFEGQAFTSLEVLLRETRPEIVCVATPAPFHFLHALESLESGAHVLCEKPLTYAPARKPRENVAGAAELVKTAKKRNLLLGAQLQYGAATPILTKLADIAPENVGDFAMEIETTNVGAPREPRELWTDLGPHSVAVVQMLAGEGGVLVDDSIQFFERTEGAMTEASARFTVRRADERLITVRSIVRFAPKDAMWRPPHRRFAFNGRVVSYRGYKTPTGEYAAQYTAPDGYDSHYPDPVDFLVGNFVRAVKGEEELLIDGEFGKRNLEWLLKIGTPKS